MTLPVKASDLLQWIPHRPPMVWVDDVIAVDPTGGSCLIHLKADSMYMGSAGLRPSSHIEFLAQAFGFIGVCRHAMFPGPEGATRLKKAFLVAIRNADFLADGSHPALQPGQTITVTHCGKKDIGLIQLTDGTITGANGELLAKAHLKVYAEHEVGG